MSVIPGMYSAWVSWLDAFARAEDLPSDHLAPLDVDQMGPDMLARIVRHLEAALLARIDHWDKLLNRDASHESTPEGMARVLVEARRRLGPLARATRMPQLSLELRREFARALAKTIENAQDSLEKSVRRDPATERRLLGVVRQHQLSYGLTSQAVDVRPPDPSVVPTGRRIIV